MDFSQLNDMAILRALGDRMRTERLNQNRTQEEVASSAGLGVIVLKRLEGGRGCNLSSLIRILRTLGRLDHLDSFLPEPGISPIDLARLSGRHRKEATGKRGRRKKRQSEK